MNPILVNPVDWQNHEVIFNDEEFSAVWGQYKGNFCLGTRWNGESENERGYPGQGAHPLWFVIPEYLTLSVLEKLNIISIQRELRNEKGESYSIRINNAIGEVINIANTVEQN